MGLLKSALQQRLQQQHQQRRRWHPVGVLHGALLLLCLALLMRVSSAHARRVPPDNGNGHVSKSARLSTEDGTPSQQFSPMEWSVLRNIDVDKDKVEDCAAVLHSRSEVCVNTVGGRMLVADQVEDYGPPGGNDESRPGNPIP